MKTPSRREVLYNFGTQIIGKRAGSVCGGACARVGGTIEALGVQMFVVSNVLLSVGLLGIQSHHPVLCKTGDPVLILHAREICRLNNDVPVITNLRPGRTLPLT